MTKYKSFLERSPSVVEPVSKDETRRGPGRPRKPPHLKHPRSKDLDKCGPDGRVLKQFRKVRGARVGNRHHAAKRATRKRRDKRAYGKRLLEQAAWRKTLRRRYSQSRSVQRLRAAKRGIDPLAYFPLSYAEYLLMWETAPPVWDGERFIPAKLLIGNPLVDKGATYMDRLERERPFTRENCRVFRGGVILTG